MVMIVIAAQYPIPSHSGGLSKINSLLIRIRWTQVNRILPGVESNHKDPIPTRLTQPSALMSHRRSGARHPRRTTSVHMHHIATLVPSPANTLHAPGECQSWAHRLTVALQREEEICPRSTYGTPTSVHPPALSNESPVPPQGMGHPFVPMESRPTVPVVSDRRKTRERSGKRPKHNAERRHMPKLAPSRLEPRRRFGLTLRGSS